MNIPPIPTEIIFDTSFMQLRDKCQELQFNGYYISSLEPTTNNKIKVIARILTAGMQEQKYSDLDIKGLLIRIVMQTEDPRKKPLRILNPIRENGEK